jgi:CubicO group peptidase (beta-lactamase class C family)
LNQDRAYSKEEAAIVGPGEQVGVLEQVDLIGPGRQALATVIAGSYQLPGAEIELFETALFDPLSPVAGSFGWRPDQGSQKADFVLARPQILEVETLGRTRPPGPATAQGYWLWGRWSVVVWANGGRELAVVL